MHIHGSFELIARERDNEGEKVWDDVLHARTRCQRIFFFFPLCFQHVERILGTVIFELSYRCSHSYTVTANGANVERRDEHIETEARKKYFVNSVAQTHESIKINFLHFSAATTVSLAVLMLLLRWRQQYNIRLCVFGWFVWFSYRLTSEHIIYNSFWRHTTHWCLICAVETWRRKKGFRKRWKIRNKFRCVRFAKKKLTQK